MPNQEKGDFNFFIPDNAESKAAFLALHRELSEASFKVVSIKAVAPTSTPIRMFSSHAEGIYPERMYDMETVCTGYSTHLLEMNLGQKSE